MRSIFRLLIVCKLTIFVLCSAAIPTYSAFADDIKAVVNDDIITTSEVDQRANLALLISRGKAGSQGISKLKNDILQGLIDEKIKNQAAASIQAVVNEAEVDKAVTDIEERNKMPAGTLVKILDSQNIDIEHFKNQIRGQLAWRNYIRAKVVPRIESSPVDVERVLQKQLEKNTITEYLIGEIFIPIRSSTLENDAKQTADRIYALVKGPYRFGEVARNFSESPSRTEDGLLGWIVKDELEPVKDKAATSLKVGATSAPVRGQDGYYIYRLYKKRSISSTDESELEGLRTRIKGQLRREKIGREAAFLGETLRRQAYLDIR